MCAANPDIRLINAIGEKGQPKPNRSTQHLLANVAETEDNEIICAFTTLEANLVQNLTEWMLNPRASRHFCVNKELMINFENVADRQCVYIGNSSIIVVKGKGKVLLKFTSGKTLYLSNVLFVPSIRRNLISSTLLNIVNIKIMQETCKVVIMRNGDSVGKGYRSGWLLILNPTAQANNEIAANSAYITESFDLWHGRLGHFNFSSLQRLRNIRLIPNVNTENCSKYPVYVEAKFAK